MIAATSFWSFTRPTTWRGHSLLFLETILNVLSIVFQVLLFFILRVLQVLYFFILRVLQAWWNYADENRTFLEPPRVIFGWNLDLGKKLEALSFQLISPIVKSGGFHTKNMTESWLRRRAKKEMRTVIRLNSIHYSLWKTIIRPQVVNIAESPHIRLTENHWNS